MEKGLIKNYSTKIILELFSEIKTQGLGIY